MALDNEAVGKVFIQIDCNKDGVFDSSDINILSAMLDKDLNPIYQITRVSDIHGDIHADPQSEPLHHQAGFHRLQIR